MFANPHLLAWFERVRQRVVGKSSRSSGKRGRIIESDSYRARVKNPMKNIGPAEVSPVEWSQSTASDFESQMAAFHALPPDLLRKHKGQFVAISEGNLIDSDQNEFALVKRVSCLKPSAFVLIQEVTEKSFSTVNQPEEVPA